METLDWGPDAPGPAPGKQAGPTTINPAPPLPSLLPPLGDTFAAGKVNPLQFKGSVPRWQ